MIGFSKNVSVAIGQLKNDRFNNWISMLADSPLCYCRLTSEQPFFQRFHTFFGRSNLFWKIDCMCEKSFFCRDLRCRCQCRHKQVWRVIASSLIVRALHSSYDLTALTDICWSCQQQLSLDHQTTSISVQILSLLLTFRSFLQSNIKVRSLPCTCNLKLFFFRFEQNKVCCLDKIMLRSESMHDDAVTASQASAAQAG